MTAFLYFMALALMAVCPTLGVPCMALLLIGTVIYDRVSR